jgi:hypothetical protein
MGNHISIFNFFWKSIGKNPYICVFWFFCIYGSIWPTRMVPTRIILVWIMTLGMMKLPRKFEPYNPIIRCFTIEIVSKNDVFGLKVGFLLTVGRLVRLEGVKSIHHIWTIVYPCPGLLSAKISAWGSEKPVRCNQNSVILDLFCP